MQLGTTSVDNQMQEIEKEAMDMQLQDKLLQYKREMALFLLVPAAPEARLTRCRHKEKQRRNSKGVVARPERALKFLEFLKSRRFHGIPQDRFSLRQRGIQGAN